MLGVVNCLILCCQPAASCQFPGLQLAGPSSKSMSVNRQEVVQFQFQHGQAWLGGLSGSTCHELIVTVPPVGLQWSEERTPGHLCPVPLWLAEVVP